jgi:muramidase (phage lysozyme)
MATSDNTDTRLSTENTNPDVPIDISRVEPIFNLINEAESYGKIPLVNPYGIWYGSPFDAGLEDMTIKEVMEAQKARQEDGKKTPAGKYQILDDTLEWLVKYSKYKGRFDLDDKFNKDTQDQLAYALLEHRGLNEFLLGEPGGFDNLKKGLATEWAGIPDETGKSRWQGVGVNRANATLSELDEALLAVSDRPEKTEEPDASGREPALSALARQTEQEYAAPDLSTTPPEPKPAIDLREVAPTQRGQIPIPQPRQPAPAPEPQLGPQSEPRLQSELSAMASSAMEPAPQRPPEPSPAPALEEVVPTQRGQVPAPERAPVEPERVVGSEPRLESELASGMMSDGVGSTEPASPEQILSSPEEVSLGVNITTPRIERASVQDYPEPTVTTDTEYPVPQEVIKVERPLQFEKPEQGVSATQIDFSAAGKAAVDSRPKPILSDEAIESAARAAVPKNREYQSAGEFLLKNTARNLANYGTLNAYDYIESGYRSLFGEEYDDVFKSIREDRRKVESAYPVSQLLGEIGAGGLTGAGIYSAGSRVAGKAGISALEAGTYMGLSGDTNQERLELATMGSIMGYGLGQVAHLATRPAKQAKPSARTAVDDELDDDILEQSINASIKNESTVLYRTNGNELKRVTVVKRIKKRNKLNADGTYKFTDKRYARQEPEVLVRDDAGNEFVVLDSKIERVNLTGIDSKKFEQNMKFENSNYQFKAPRQVLKEKYNEDGSLMLTKEGEELLAKGEAVNPSMVQYELRDATWRDARTAGELWDSLVEGGKKLYADLARGTDDTLYQKVSKQVGNFYQVASTAAGRQTTKDFVGIGQPLTVLSRAIDNDKYLKALIGDVTNKRALLAKYDGTQYKAWINENVSEKKLLAYIAKNYGEENAKIWDAYVKWNRGKKKVHVEYLSGMKQFLEDVSPDVHIHMSLTKEAREKALRASNNRSGKKVEYNPLSRDDSALEKRTRGSFLLGLDPKVSKAPARLKDAPSVDDYLNPVFTDFRRTANLEQLYQIAKKFGLKMPDLDSGEQAYKVFQRLEEDMVRRGINPQAAKYAAKLMSDDFVGSTRTPNGWLQALNSVGYAGSLAGFKSAVLNLHDIPMAAVLYGPSSFRGIANVKGINVTDQGLRQNVGEFRDRMIESMRTGEMSPEAYAAKITREGTDILMNLTGFSWFDTVGKNSISKMIVQNAVDTVDELEKRWGFYFDERQIGILKSQIKKHGTDLTKYSKQGSELMEELFFAGLGQQQLISMSGRPAAWARHPNFRMMWALRGFAIKQLALAEKNVVDNILEGNIKEAVDYMKNYVIFAAGSFGLLNEARQWIWGDGNFTAGGVLMGMGDQIISTASINTIGLNDYQWGRMMRNGVALTFLESLIPIGIDIPKDIVLNIADAADGDVRGREGLTLGQRVMYPAAQFPILKQTGRMFDNFADTNLFGVPIQAPLPQPLDDINRRYLLTENGPRESDG